MKYIDLVQILSADFKFCMWFRDYKRIFEKKNLLAWFKSIEEGLFISVQTKLG